MAASEVGDGRAMQIKVSTQGILVVATVMAPFTLLRVSFFGLAELSIFLVFLSQASKGVSRRLLREFILTRFWILFISTVIVGRLIDIWVLDHETGTWSAAFFDTSAYFFLLITSFTLDRVVTHDRFDVPAFARNVFFYSGCIFSCLYALSFFGESFLGLQLMSYGHFVPMAENLHQIAMYLVPLPFIGLAVLETERAPSMRRLGFALLPTIAIMAISTGSAKAVLALIVGVLAYGYAKIICSLGRRIIFPVNMLIAAASVGLLAFSNFSQLGEHLFQEEDIDGGRNFLYRHALALGLDSPIFGRGPGAHIMFEGIYMDAHQTLLTVFLQGGLVGIILFVSIMVSVFRKTLPFPPLFAAFMALLVYAAGGDIMRRLPAWIMLFILLRYSQSFAKSYEAKSQH